jgi:peptidoglycan/LPS O-acetylase OafA/YrhL
MRLRKAFSASASVAEHKATASARAYRPDIDGLRAVAVLAVLLFHLEVDILSGGFVGVDVFFVISGYLITRQILADLERGRFSLTGFYLRRVRRLGPALLTTLALSAVAGIAILSPPQLVNLGESLAAAVLSVSNVLFYLESGYFDRAADLKPLLHTWSLAVEEQFYLVWPAALLMLSKYASPRNLLVFIGITGLASLLASGFLTESEPSATFFLTPFRVFELGIGALIVLLEPSRPDQPRLRQVLSLSGLALILSAALFFTDTTAFPGFAALVPCLGAALIIFAHDPTATRRLLTNRVFVGIGLISYSLYLAHWPIIVFYRHSVQSEFTAVSQFALAAASFTAATLLYRFIEQPFRHPRAQAGPAPANLRFLRASAAAAVCLLVLSGALVAGNGWYWRLGPYGDQLVQAYTTEDFHTAFYGGRDCQPPRCETQPGATRRLYVIGDSHARALHAGMHMPDTNVVFWENAGCEFYSTEYIGETILREQECLTAKQDAFQDIGKRDAPVLLTQHWRTAYVDRHIAPGTDLPDLQFKTPEEYAEFVAQELRGIADAISPQPLIVLGGVPRFHLRGAPFDCRARPFAGDDCATSPRDHPFVAFHDQFNMILQQRLPADVVFLNPFDVLCDQETCRNFDDRGMPIYSDRAHLSIWGADFLVAALAADLATLQLAETPDL